jgi:DNA-binding response OmpR family regulator
MVLKDMAGVERILIVDDDPDIHPLLTAAIKAPNRQITSAYDGLAGLRCVQEAPYDLVLTDVNMPGLDGLTLLGRIRELRPATRVVMMTAETTPEKIVHAIRERAFAYFSKPFTLGLVADMVARALQNTSAEDDIEVLSARPNWLGLRLRCKMETADRILQFMRELAIGLSEEERDDIGTAFSELLMNAIEHGGGFDPDQKVTITYVRTERAILYYIRDPGAGFSFQDLAHAATSNPPDSPLAHATVRAQLGIRPGGFGIFLTRELVDELLYNEAGNEVLLIKYLAGRD